MRFDDRDKQILLDIARDSIAFGLEQGHEIPIAAGDYAEALRATRATFVTLRYRGELQGCVGTLRATRPLVWDVAHNSFQAAFADERFAPLVAAQLCELDIHISILSPLERMPVRSQDDLLAQLRPGVDGLLLQDGALRATFLPSMWPRVRDARQFVSLLQHKAGMPRDYWSESTEAYRYTAEEIP
jgi:AmmeMemoRadiSam system protein A